MTTQQIRSDLYALARVLGDVQAVQKGRVGQRILRRIAGRLTGRALGQLFRSLGAYALVPLLLVAGGGFCEISAEVTCDTVTVSFDEFPYQSHTAAMIFVKVGEEAPEPHPFTFEGEYAEFSTGIEPGSSDVTVQVISQTVYGEQTARARYEQTFGREECGSPSPSPSPTESTTLPPPTDTPKSPPVPTELAFTGPSGPSLALALGIIVILALVLAGSALLRFTRKRPVR